jgi:hypothetical protein
LNVVPVTPGVAAYAAVAASKSATTIGTRRSRVFEIVFFIVTPLVTFLLALIALS